MGEQGKVFHGDRTIDGLAVTVDGRPLPTHDRLHAFSKNGFEWGYEGIEPQQLAFAILAEHFGKEGPGLQRAKQEARRFMQRAVANFGNEWEMSGADIDALLTETT